MFSTLRNPAPAGAGPGPIAAVDNDDDDSAHHKVEHRRDRARAAVDHAAHGPRLPREVERQVQSVHLRARPPPPHVRALAVMDRGVCCTLYACKPKPACKLAIRCCAPMPHDLRSMLHAVCCTVEHMFERLERHTPDRRLRDRRED